MSRIAVVAIALSLIATGMPGHVVAEETGPVVALPTAEAWGYCDGEAASDANRLFAPDDAAPTIWLTCEARGRSHRAETVLALPRRRATAEGDGQPYFSATFEQRIADEGLILYGTSIEIDGEPVARTRQLEFLDLSETVGFQLSHPVDHPFLKSLANGGTLTVAVDAVTFVIDLTGAKKAVDAFVAECGAPRRTACFPAIVRARKLEMDKNGPTDAERDR